MIVRISFRHLGTLTLAALLAGCGGYVRGLARDAGQGAADAIQARDAQLVKTAVVEARDEALGPETEKRARAIAAAVGGQLRAQASLARDDLLGPRTRADVAALRPIARGFVDDALDDARDRAGAIREELAGAPLRADLDALVDGVYARAEKDAQAGAEAARADAVAQVDRYRGAAVDVGLVAGALLLLALAHAWYSGRERAREREALLRALEGLRGRFPQ